MMRYGILFMVFCSFHPAFGSVDEEVYHLKAAERGFIKVEGGLKELVELQYSKERDSEALQQAADKTRGAMARVSASARALASQERAVSRVANVAGGFLGMGGLGDIAGTLTAAGGLAAAAFGVSRIKKKPVMQPVRDPPTPPPDSWDSTRTNTNVPIQIPSSFPPGFKTSSAS